MSEPAPSIASMPASFQGLLAALVALLPGALYTWAFEREVGRWGVTLGDRVLRFVGTSGIFLAVYSYPLFLIWANYLHHPQPSHEGVQFHNLVWEGRPVPWWLFLIPVAYVAIPLIAGSVGAVAVSRGWKWLARIVAGRDPAPRAWDFLFSSRPSGLVRIRLKHDGSWVGGLFAENSYASGYPEAPQDVYLESTYLMEEDGTFVRDEDDEPVELGSGILLRYDEMVHLEITFLGGELG
jgi:Family of unknown function (DUF6338)